MDIIKTLPSPSLVCIKEVVPKTANVSISMQLIKINLLSQTTMFEKKMYT